METTSKSLKENSTEAKEKIIARLLAKADLDFRCCGHGLAKN